MSGMKTVVIAAALMMGAVPMAMAQTGGTSAPKGTTAGSTGAPGQPGSVNGFQQGGGPNAKDYGTKQGMGREQPEQKEDMGSGAGK
jgi:hypothetical protein